ncbi:MAG: SAM-dependent methyltransferase [Actinobacteria bacterium]|nr:SAM-dependent methyltransferase [Actinomycetota bacterium]
MATGRLWRQVADTGIIDFTQPVALLMIAVLHVQQRDHEKRDIGNQITAQYRDLLPDGSYLAISHITDDGVPPAMDDKLVKQ